MTLFARQGTSAWFRQGSDARLLTGQAEPRQWEQEQALMFWKDKK